MPKDTITIPCTVSFGQDLTFTALQIISIMKSAATGIKVRIRNSKISTSRCDISALIPYEII
jgi:hypothetical protein